MMVVGVVIAILCTQATAFFENKKIERRVMRYLLENYIERAQELEIKVRYQQRVLASIAERCEREGRATLTDEQRKQVIASHTGEVRSLFESLYNEAANRLLWHDYICDDKADPTIVRQRQILYDHLNAIDLLLPE